MQKINDFMQRGIASEQIQMACWGAGLRADAVTEI
jgi:hypothetical protein